LLLSFVMKGIRKAVIPAAGWGTRTLPASKAIPKEMVTVIDRPGIQIVVEEAAAAGIEQVILIMGKGKGAIEDHFGSHPELERILRGKGKDEMADRIAALADLVEIVAVRQNRALGLGHAIGCAKNIVGDEPFAVMLPDDLFDCDPPAIKQLIDVAEEFDAPCVTLLHVPDNLVNLYGMVHFEEVRERVFRIWDMVEKPPIGESPSNWSIIGRYVFPPEIFDIIDNTPPGIGGEIQITDAIKTLADQRTFLGLDFVGVREDMGNIPGYIRAFLRYAMKNPAHAKAVREYMKENKDEFA